MIERRSTLPRTQFVTAAVVALLLASALASVLLWQTIQQRDHVLDVGRLRLQRQATELAEHASRTLEAVDLSLATALAYRDPDHAPADWYDRLRRTLLFLPQVHNLQVFAADGRLEYDARRMAPPPQNVASESFFAAHREQRIEFLLDQPVHMGGRWMVPMSRRMEGHDNAFAGVLRALVDVSYFSDFYSLGDSGEAGQVLLFDNNGAVLVNWSPRQPSGVVGGSVDAILSVPSVVDNSRGIQLIESDISIMALNQLTDFPLRLLVLRDKQELLASWHNSLSAMLVGFGLLVVATSGFIWLAARQARQRCRIEQTLRLYERALEASTNGVLIAERGNSEQSPVNHPIIYANPSFSRLTGYTQSEVLGRDPRFLYHNDQTQPALDLIRQALVAQEPVETVLRNFRRDGSAFWCEVLIAPVRDERGRVTHFLGVQRDVSDRRRAAEEVERINRELTSSNAELEQFAYVASHDLQQPLRTVTSFLQLLQRHLGNKLDDDGREFIGFAVDGAKRMQELIVDLLEYSRITRSGHAFQAVSTAQLVAETKQDLHQAIIEAGATIDTPELPDVFGDPGQLRRVFENLIGNAIKYRASDRSPEIRVTVQELNHFWQFCIADNGIGIPREDLDRVFLIFQRLHSREDYPGNGIGLAICRKIIERHGGRIWADSEPGQGSRFYFTLPDVERRAS